LSSPLVAQGAPVEISLQPTQQLYGFGAMVGSAANFCNPTDQPLSVTVGCPCCFYDIRVEDEAGVEVAQAFQGCPSVVVTLDWAPNECLILPIRWPQTDGVFEPFLGHAYGEQVLPGLYRIRLDWLGPGTGTTTTSLFEIAPQAVVPTLSATGLFVLALALGGFGLFALRRRPQKA
jgi:hypothetical protein